MPESSSWTTSAMSTAGTSAGHTTLPLPVILYDTRAACRCSAALAFDHGHATYNGYTLDEGQVVAVDAARHHDEEAAKAIWDISASPRTCSPCSSAMIPWCWCSPAWRVPTPSRAGQAPKGLQSFMEPIILFVRDDVAKSAIGPQEVHEVHALPAHGFFFIFLNNLMGLVPFFPGGANLTGNIAITLVLALITFIIVTVNGNKTLLVPHLRHARRAQAGCSRSLRRWRSSACS
jgi:F-type H+-transporting ATPase subunit a